MPTSTNSHPELVSGSNKEMPKQVRHDDGGFGFTLIELLVTISIIAILAAIGLVSYQQILKNGRDAKRHSDLSKVQSALEQYNADQFFYPTGDLPWGSALTSSTGNPSPPTVKVYLNSLPTEGVVSNPQYSYVPTPSGCDNSSSSTKCTSYCMYAKLENSTSMSTLCDDNGTYNLEVPRP